MATIAEKRRLRDRFLVALYELTGDEAIGFIDDSAVAKELGIDVSEAGAISRDLVDQGLATHPVMGPVSAITPAGKRRAEELIEAQEEGNAPGLAVVLSVAELRDLEDVITKLRKAEQAGELSIEGEDLAEFDADLQALETQIRSPKPKRAIVRVVLGFVVSKLGTVTLGALGSGAFEAARALYQHLG